MCLNEVGTLIVHPDVVYALNNLKTLGHIMRKKNETTDETSEKPDPPRKLKKSVSRNSSTTQCTTTY